MEMLGVPTVGIGFKIVHLTTFDSNATRHQLIFASGDELPDFSGETLTGTLNVHNWIRSAQSHRDGEEVYTIVLTFPRLQNPVSVSEFGWLGKADTHRELSSRKCRVLCVVSATMFDLRGFLSDVPGTHVDAMISSVGFICAPARSP
jgi:hypothetical protein